MSFFYSQGGSRSCCDVTMEQAEEKKDQQSGQFAFKTCDLDPLPRSHESSEYEFWTRLKNTLLGVDVNKGESEKVLREDLLRLR